MLLICMLLSHSSVNGHLPALAFSVLRTICICVWAAAQSIVPAALAAPRGVTCLDPCRPIVPPVGGGWLTIPNQWKGITSRRIKCKTVFPPPSVTLSTVSCQILPIYAFHSPVVKGWFVEILWCEQGCRDAHPGLCGTGLCVTVFLRRGYRVWFPRRLSLALKRMTIKVTHFSCELVTTMIWSQQRNTTPICKRSHRVYSFALVFKEHLWCCF